MTKEQVLEKLTNYFEYTTNSLLEILDIPSETARKRGGYTGVTAEYLMTYLCPNIDKDLFIECMNELLLDKIIARVHCSNIDRLVFEKYQSDYGHFRSSTSLLTQSDLSNSTISLAADYKTNRQFDEEE